MQKKISLIIPTYNEKNNIDKVIAEITKIVPQAHIIVVDDNSPDATAGIVELLARENNQIHLIKRKTKSGLGRAYIEGFKFVLNNLDSDYIFEMDADLSHNPNTSPYCYIMPYNSI